MKICSPSQLLDRVRRGRGQGNCQSRECEVTLARAKRRGWQRHEHGGVLFCRRGLRAALSRFANTNTISELSWAKEGACLSSWWGLTVSNGQPCSASGLWRSVSKQQQKPTKNALPAGLLAASDKVLTAGAFAGACACHQRGRWVICHYFQKRASCMTVSEKKRFPQAARARLRSHFAECISGRKRPRFRCLGPPGAAAAAFANYSQPATVSFGRRCDPGQAGAWGILQLADAARKRQTEHGLSWRRIVEADSRALARTRSLLLLMRRTCFCSFASLHAETHTYSHTPLPDTLEHTPRLFLCSHLPSAAASDSAYPARTHTDMAVRPLAGRCEHPRRAALTAAVASPGIARRWLWEYLNSGPLR